MRAVDPNVLVYAEIRSSPWNDIARQLLTEISEGPVPWAIPWPCIYEFLRVVTHPRVYHPPVPMAIALEDIRNLLASPTLLLLQETPNHFKVMKDIISQTGVSGNLIHDAHIAALCLEHGVGEIITGDRDFTRFPFLAVTNPFE
jgi:toxin-antitoxin system PIN domain toxin